MKKKNLGSLLAGIRRKNIAFIGVFLLLLSINSCSNSMSIAMVGENNELIRSIWEDNKEINVIEMQDSIVVISKSEMSPFEILYVFEEDICIYQQSDIFCSPCSKAFLRALLKDRRFKFTKIDDTNYISKDEKYVLRVKNGEGEDVCTNITLIYIHRPNTLELQ